MPSRRLLRPLALTLALLLWACLPAVAAYAPGELLVRFRPQASLAASAAAAGDDLGVRVAGSLPALGVERLKLPPGLSVEEALRHYRALPGVELAQPNYIYRAAAIPNDPRYSDQWYLPQIEAPAAWDSTTDASGVIVAMVDTGVNYDHPDIATNIWSPEVGWDFVNDDSDPDDDYAPSYHGTHVAGVIGAVASNGLGVSGICWQVQLMALKALDSNGDGYESDVAAAVRYAVDNGADIINLSLESDQAGEVLEEAIAYAGAAGVLVVTAAGNSGLDLNASPTKVYPGSYDQNNILNVGSSDPYDSMSASSNYGSHYVDLAAPGEIIWSTSGGTGYSALSGTSMAAPVASGAAALLLAAHPTLSDQQLKGYLISYCDDVGLPVLSRGRLNLAESLSAAEGGLPWKVSEDTSSGNGCFIATAAYGSPLAGQVRLLSDFRDRWLLPNPVGRPLVAAYYRLSPPAARYIDERPWLPPLVRATIYPALPLVRLSLAAPALLGCLLGAVGLLAATGTCRRT